jgi:hypothetical protein
MFRYDASDLANITTPDGTVTNVVSTGTLTTSATATGGVEPIHSGSGSSAQFDFISNDYLTVSTTAMNQLAQWHFYAVITPDSAEVNANPASAWSNNGVIVDNAGYRGLTIASIGGSIKAVGFNYGGVVPVVTSAESLTAGVKVLLDLRKKDGVLSISVNGGTPTTIADPAATGASTIAWRIGTSAYNDYDGKIHEVYLYNSGQSDADRAVTQDWLKDKWGI